MWDNSTFCCTVASPCRSFLALARGYALVIAQLLRDQHVPSVQQQLNSYNQQQTAPTCQVHYYEQQVTAVAWFAHLKSASDLTELDQLAQGGQRQRQQHGAASIQQQQQALQELHSHQQQASSQLLLETDVLLSGTVDGHLQIHTASGQLLLRQRLMSSAVLDIIVRPYCSGLRSSDASEEVCITFSNALIRINTLDLRSLIRMLQYTQHGNYSAAATVPPLAHLRYEFPAAVGPRVCGLSFGTVSNDLYSLLSSGSSSSAAREPKQQGRQKIAIVTVGKSPCLAAFEAEERPNKSTLAALVGMASSLAVGVAGAASKAAGLGPSLMYHGVKSLMKPLSTWYHNPYSSNNSTASFATSQPIVSYDDAQHLPKPEPLSLTKQLRDDDRILEGLVPAPVGALLVAPDNLGRVLLFEGGSITAVRLWKGYRDAQCGWIMPPPSHPARPLGLMLVLLAPRRQTLEVWLPRSGQRLASKVVDYPCLLLPVGLPCGGFGNDTVMDIWFESCTCATTLVVNLTSGEVWNVMDCLVSG
eukprot:GHUV01011331.1.p1 GENE.GHUV01011331.1~~GHUV01011331.1.p1  ORF type:complete len:530 (+),score=153.20 GHUV01011331.1:98-1687(+)